VQRQPLPYQACDSCIAYTCAGIWLGFFWGVLAETAVGFGDLARSLLFTNLAKRFLC
jgi:hypothetical protein